ncbi:MAG: hypothetical protein CFE26_13250 [Verrucomicrobiales bacterium VVV1]|nr:MAG: hypothetical protein CFE26_13250 [Verrucomicrobiales bacterium VVV1]
MLLIAGLVALLSAKLISHHEPSLQTKDATQTATRSDASRDRASQPDEKRERVARNSRKLSDEEMMTFLRDTILEGVEIRDKSLGEALIILRKEVRNAAPDGPAVGLGLAGSCSDQKIQELRLRKVPLAVALKYVCEMTKCRYRIDDGSVIISPVVDTGEVWDPIQKELDQSGK